MAQGVAQSLLDADLRPGAGIGRLELGVAVLELALSVPTVGYNTFMAVLELAQSRRCGRGLGILGRVATLAGWILPRTAL